MRLIALKNFRNVAGRIQIEAQSHPLQVDKGTVFEIGGAETLKDLKKADRDSAMLAASLIMAKVAAEPTPETVARVVDEIEVDRKREARAKELDQIARAQDAGTLTVALGMAAKRLQRT